MFDQFISDRIDKQRDRLHMGEFFLIMHTLTQAAKITCLETAGEMIAKAELRTQYLSPVTGPGIKPIALNKLFYMTKKLGIDLSDDVKMCMADLSLLDIVKELISCVKSDHRFRKSIYGHTPLADKVFAVTRPREKYSLRVTVTH